MTQEAHRHGAIRGACACGGHGSCEVTSWCSSRTADGALAPWQEPRPEQLLSLHSSSHSREVTESSHRSRRVGGALPSRGGGGAGAARSCPLLVRRPVALHVPGETQEREK
jgi:hypothetical protein